MKKILLSKLSLVFLLCALFSGKAEAKDALEKGFTIKFAYVMPNSDFGRMPTGGFFGPLGTYPLKKANSGFGFQLGTMFFINAIDLGDQMKVGIDATWLSINYTRSTYFTPSTEGETDFYNLHFSLEVGPSFSYSPVEKLAFDASFKLSPTVGLMGGTYESPDYNNGVLEYDRHNVGGVGIGLRFTPAIYARYSVLLLGFEYNIGNVNMGYSATGGAAEPVSGSVPYSTARIVFGFKF